MADVEIIINPSELGAGTRGSSLGPSALIVEARQRGLDFFGRHSNTTIADENHLLNYPSDFEYAHYIDAIHRIYIRVAEATSEVLKRGNFPIVLAGDHSSAAGTIAGIKNIHPDKRLGVIWIDAHADLHSPYTTPSGNLHGMVLCNAIGDDNLEQKINDPDARTIEYWNKLKAVGLLSDIKAEDVIYMGLRNFEAAEEEFIRRCGMRTYSVEELRNKRIDIVVNEVENKLEDCDLVYISFDVDSMDPSMVSRGTGTPCDNGLTAEEAEILVRKFSVWSKCCCLEFVEINPVLDDKNNRMTEVAFDILEKVTTDLEKRLG